MLILPENKNNSFRYNFESHPADNSSCNAIFSRLIYHKVFLKTNFLSENRNWIFSLSEESIAFECRFARKFSVSLEGYTIEKSDSPAVGRPTSNRGPTSLGYSLSVTADHLGRNTDISISRNHILNQIAPR